MNERSRAALLLLAAALSPQALWSAETGQSGALDVVVERKTGADWRAVDPHYVFASQDQIRFVFRSDVPGHLYVLNRPPSGASEWVFPAAGTEPDNLVAPGQRYRIPAQGAFVISGPPGFDTTVWILSPASSADGRRRGPAERAAKG